MPTVRRGRRWSTQFSHPKVRHIVVCGHSDAAGGFPVGSYDVADVAADEEIAGVRLMYLYARHLATIQNRNFSGTR
jgi:hypothetical protein